MISRNLKKFRGLITRNKSDNQFQNEQLKTMSFLLNEYYPGQADNKSMDIVLFIQEIESNFKSIEYQANFNDDGQQIHSTKINEISFLLDTEVNFSEIFLFSDSLIEKIRCQEENQFQNQAIEFNIQDIQSSTPNFVRYSRSQSICSMLDESTQVNLNRPILQEDTFNESSCSDLSDDLLILENL